MHAKRARFDEALTFPSHLVSYMAKDTKEDRIQILYKELWQ